MQQIVEALFFVLGLQRQLSYMNEDGSFSQFRDYHEPTPSTWLVYKMLPISSVHDIYCLIIKLVPHHIYVHRQTVLQTINVTNSMQQKLQVKVIVVKHLQIQHLFKEL